MKKITKYLIAFILFFTCLIQVKATEIFKYDWETTKNDYYEEEMFFTDNIAYQNGFITSILDSEDFASNLTMYDPDGTIIKTNIINNYAIITLKNINNIIYALAMNDTGTIELLKIKDDLTLDKHLNIEIEIIDYPDPILGVTIYDLLGINSIKEDEKNIYVLVEEFIVKVSKDMNSFETIDPTQEDIATYFPEYEEIVLNPITNLKQYISVIENKKQLIYTGFDIEECPPKSVECINDIDAIIRLDEDNKTLWEKEYPDYLFVYNPQVVNKYIVAVGVKKVEDDTQKEIIILDMNGNIVQTIVNDDPFIITGGNYNFMVNNVDESSEYCPIAPHSSTRTAPAIKCYKHWQKVYYIPLNISTKVEGKGKIEVVNSARNGEEVTFKITPEEGYVLGVVKVTDADGNVLTFTSNTFTMPSSDVTIEATFVLENPNTADIKIILLSIVLIVGSVIGFINFKKVKWLD